jgi:hypothetical protein
MYLSVGLIFFLFLLAYGSESKTATININQHGEASIELLFMSIVFIVSTYFTLDFLVGKDGTFKKTKKEKHQPAIN